MDAVKAVAGATARPATSGLIVLTDAPSAIPTPSTLDRWLHQVGIQHLREQLARHEAFLAYLRVAALRASVGAPSDVVDAPRDTVRARLPKRYTR